MHGAIVPIGYQYLTSDNPAYTGIGFTNIPQGYQDLMVVMTMRDQNSGTGGLYLPTAFNQDSGSTNYNETMLFGNGSSAASSRWSNQQFFQFAQQPANGNTAGIFSTTVMHILNYSNTTTYKSMIQRNSMDLNGSGRTAIIAGTWRSTAAITQFNAYAVNGTKAGSSVALYGVRTVGQ